MDFTPALTHLLGKRGGRAEDFDGYYAARLLYEVLQNPKNPDLANKLMSVVVDTEDEVFDSVCDAIEAIQENKGLKADFISNLLAIIKAIDTANLSKTIDAIQLAYSIKAWELADSVQYAKDTIEEQSSEETTKQSRLLLDETKKYFTLMNAFASSSTTVGPVNKASSNEDELSVFRDFINSLDLDDFNGKRE